MRSAEQLRRDLRLGLFVGTIVAAICAAFATLHAIANGLHSVERKTGMPYFVVLAVYAVGGLSGGLIIGLLRPLRRTTIGSFVIGFLASLPMAVISAIIVFEPWELRTVGVVAIIATALALGGLGAALHDETHGWS